ncbi:hypothetical protein ACSCBZ_03030 [Streptomyces niveiscabiei]|uniref:Secreted protein n=1 Tax=Streptomyces niveiscabiei TaxID=164115 RepID=A0ABW9HRC9_9ACTN
MKKIVTAVLPLAALVLAGAPAHAAGPGPGVDAADNWNFSAGDVCLQEVAVVPALSDWTGNHKNNCSNGNVIGHPK